MPIQHQRRAVEWFLLLHEVPIDRGHRHAITPISATAPNEPDDTETRPLYDTAHSAEEGLWTRTGWAGRS